MGDFVNSEKVSKKYYRYFLKALAYYTCHLNKACTMADLQAYVFLKSLQQLSEAELKFLSNHVMEQLVATGIAYNQNGYFRLNELLRYAPGSSSEQAEVSDRSRDAELSSGSGLRRMVNFSNTVTMWPTNTMDGAAIIDAAIATPTDLSPVVDQDVENPPNKNEPDNSSDSDGNDEEKPKKDLSVSHGKPNPGTQSDSDSSDSNTIASEEGSNDGTGDEDSKIPHKQTKQEPDRESNKSESEDDARKQE